MSDDTEYLALEVNVKNTSDKKIYLSDENFALYQKGDDEKINLKERMTLRYLTIIKTLCLQNFQRGKAQQAQLCLKLKKAKHIN
jgi:hypothetical protein